MDKVVYQCNSISTPYLEEDIQRAVRISPTLKNEPTILYVSLNKSNLIPNNYLGHNDGFMLALSL